MSDINYNALPEKTTPSVSGDKVIITDSEDGDIVKIQEALQFKGTQGDTGPQGVPGDNAPELEIEYSIDGITLWHTPFTSGDFYQRVSTDGGATWSSAIKFVGEDGAGDMAGPVSSTDNALARFDSTTGNLLQNGIITESDNGDIKLVNAIELDTTPTTITNAEGVISWNATDKTIDINQGNDVIQQVGQEQYWRGKNQTGSTINQPSVVYANGAVGMSGIMTIAKYIADGSIPGIYTLGVTTEDIANGGDGFITTFGKIRGIDTTGGAESRAEGDVLYPSPTTAGLLTNVKPSLPHLVIPIAFVITVHATVGTIAVRVPTPTPLAEEISYDNTTSGLTAVDLQSAIDELEDEKQEILVSGTNIKTINGASLLGSGNIVITTTKQHRITIPGEQIADTSNYQGLYFYNDTGTTITISNVAFAVGKAAAGSGAACAVNLYKSSGTASHGLNTSAVNLFTTAIDLATGYTSLTNVPNTATVEAGRWITLRVTSSAGATNKASDLQVIITYTS